MKKVFVAVAMLTAVGAYAEQAPSNGLQWACKGTGRDSMQCTVRNNSARPVEMCVDVIKVCKNGNHYAELCTGQLQSGETASKVVSGFLPKVKLLERCMGVEYGDRVIK